MGAGFSAQLNIGTVHTLHIIFLWQVEGPGSCEDLRFESYEEKMSRSHSNDRATKENDPSGLFFSKKLTVPFGSV